MSHFVEVLIEKAVSQTDSSIRKECINRTPVSRSVQLIDTFQCSQIRLDSIGYNTDLTKVLHRLMD